ncbi:MAG: hypothetical protein ARM1_0435 [Candidatus Micrarchaeota archaeon]|nr:MAG: hypothetical protein ARM1_0435 [Candidatus Micrarchaeota archaeon]
MSKIENLLFKISPNIRLQSLLAFLYSLAVSLITSYIIITKFYRYLNLLTYLSYAIYSTFVLYIIPSLIAAVVVKTVYRRFRFRHLTVIAYASLIPYSLFNIIAALLLALYSSVGLYTAAVIVGVSSVLGFWYIILTFINIGRFNKLLVSLVQPLALFLLYIPTYGILLNASSNEIMLILKFIIGAFISALISTIIIRIMRNPIKRSLNMDPLDAVSQFIRAWLFNININTAFGGKGFGVYKDVDTFTIAFISKRSNKLKSILYLPNVHYGPANNIGGSAYPLELSRYIKNRYNVVPIILHGAVNIDLNPVASNQISVFKKDINKSMELIGKRRYNSIDISISKYRSARAINIIFNSRRALTILSRAPKTTEDINTAASKIINATLQKRFKEVALVDAHNSRDESSDEKDLLDLWSEGITEDSRYFREYIRAISSKPYIKIRGINKIGYAYKYITRRYNDVAEGYANLLIMKGQRDGFFILSFNANNMLPSLREKLLEYIRSKYRYDGEIITTDTHVVNSLGSKADVVLGRYVDEGYLISIIDELFNKAEESLEECEFGFLKSSVKVRVWGENFIVKAGAAFNSTIYITKYIAPLVLILGYILSLFIIAFI